MQIGTIAILGGTGFVGCTLANRLTRDGYQLRVLTRNRERHRDNLILLPTLDLVQANIHDPEQLRRHLAGCDAVINLVGILNERGRSGAGFRAVHVELARTLVEACRANGIRRVLQMSALNADAAGPSHYLRTKGEAEDLLHGATDLIVTSFRPSVIFGADDSFFNRFATLLRLTPLVFPLACAGARFAPVFVEDVAEAIARTLRNPDCYGRRMQFCGPNVYSLVQLVRYTAQCAGLRRAVVPLPDVLARIQAALFDFWLLGAFIEKPFSTDNYLSAKLDSVCTCNDLAALGIQPTALEAVVPQYLAHGGTRARYYFYRSQPSR
ncbi:MAG: complex I NDUFA9 subunit family protein [Gammaproteobacteria bacterium]|nr:complex I NDUFA9 subunit family protein [Gammaproteobacteria bacterium]